MKFYDDWRELHKEAPETEKEFNTLFENKLQMISIENRCVDKHPNFLYRICLKGDTDHIYSMMIAVGNYGMYEIWSGFEQPEGCMDVQEIIDYINSQKEQGYSWKEERSNNW